MPYLLYHPGCKSLALQGRNYHLGDKMQGDEYKVVMPYIGGILSENNYKFGTRGTKPFVKMWMRELAEKVEALEIPESTFFEVGIFGRFTDERRPDISNLFKVVLDAIEKGLKVNDKFLRPKDEGYELGYLDPELVITVRRIG